ncbi:methyltransferase domain-containing protein [Candidatus Woesearchaeota archaeon]|nr:methyltransferase domain-containing protein [Candidatus Woesearchaeota archaeon]
MPKILYSKEGKKFYVDDITKDYHCQFGVANKADLKKKTGSKIKTNTNKELIVLDADFLDSYRRIKRGAQIVTFKDIGAIIAYTGIDKKSIAVDAGTGSGALACFLAHICKEVTTYEIREDFYKIAKENKEKLGLKNLKIKKKDIFRGIDEKEVDLIALDLPDPWNAINVSDKALRIGGYMASYSPTVSQVSDFVNTLKKKPNFSHQRTIELIKREWEVEGRKVRPVTTQNVHTGFLSFFRKIY